MLIGLTGCAFTLPGHNISSGPMGPFIVGDSLEVLGGVTGQSSMSFFLGIPLSNDMGLRAAFADALSKRSGANSLINVYTDIESFYFPFPYFMIYYRMTTKVYATAVKTQSPSAIIYLGSPTVSDLASYRTNEAILLAEIARIPTDFFLSLRRRESGIGLATTIDEIYPFYLFYCNKRSLLPVSKSGLEYALRKRYGEFWMHNIAPQMVK